MYRDAHTELPIRAVTAGVTLESLDDPGPVEDAIEFLQRVRCDFTAADYTVQSVRVATQPLGSLCARAGRRQALASVTRLDDLVTAAGLDLSLGPLLEDDVADADFASWAADLAASTSRTFWSVAVASPERGIHAAAAAVAAVTMAKLSRVDSGGETNFRFAAAAHIPAATPFFPVAYHRGSDSFALALESAGLVAEACTEVSSAAAASSALTELFDERLQPLARRARQIAARESRRFTGIDLSPAPSLSASIAEPIERLSGSPFGRPSTLAACAAVTRGLDGVAVERCGYSGLMLPVLEDRLLAQRAAEGHLTVRDLLLCSCVCGTGLDVVPLPGDCETHLLHGLILDVATLATRWQKPLAARLLPIPGKIAGDTVTFENPHLTASAVLSPT